jgi:lipid II:glycine glycyltransferase (peptidoglycan interpeptide bridge formation enzyme)
MRISVIDPTHDERWDKFVANQKDSTVYHTSAWARVLQEAYNYQPRYYVLEDGSGRLTAALPFYLIQSRLTGKRLVCLPFSDYCWPLAESEADILSLLNFAKQEMKTQRFPNLEIRGWQRRLPPDETGLIARHYHWLYILDLEQDPEQQEMGFHHSVRRGIQQAKKRGAVVQTATSEDDMLAFYRLNTLTRRKLGVLPQPYAFFRAIFRHIISQGMGFLQMAKYKCDTIAGVLLLTFKDTIYYKFNASDANYLQKRPNHLLIWTAIQHACANGYNHFDFGRCAAEEESLRNFKRLWATREIPLPYYYFPAVRGVTTTTESSLKYRLMSRLVHTIPNSALETLSLFLYKHLG